jgi:hypothetical protein
MRQENVCILHHECEEIEFFGRKMNFVIATPEHVTLQIQLQISGLNHARDPRCTQAWSPQDLSHSCCKLTRNLLILPLRGAGILELGRKQEVVPSRSGTGQQTPCWRTPKTVGSRVRPARRSKYCSLRISPYRVHPFRATPDLVFWLGKRVASAEFRGRLLQILACARCRSLAGTLGPANTTPLVRGSVLKRVHPLI